ncbi:MAG: GNAT family N-acetyltransferase [Chloroflexi bacterium]|nr:MAG: GNAT family N-acetyltransferase [Chloroflexota bacterium]
MVVREQNPLVSHWPLFSLRLRTPRLDLSVPADADLEGLIAVARAGVHDPDEMPFGTPWTDRPSPEFEREFLQYHWKLRAQWQPDEWSVDFVVRCGGDIVGCQGLRATRFRVRREVETGSWLGRQYQGRGIGKEMRTAVLHLAFAGLGARWAKSGAFVGNEPSARVSRALGYEEDGIDIDAPRDAAVELRRFRLSRERWEARPRSEVTIEGLDECLTMFGVSESQR